MSNKFLSLAIPFTEENHCSVFFAHLQNTIKKAKVQDQEAILINKIDLILYDIYIEHQKLENNHQNTTNNLQKVMTEFSSILHDVKSDREGLVQSTKDKQSLLEKLKESNEDSIALADENNILRETVSKLKEINQLLVEKNEVNEERLDNNGVAQLGVQNFERISKEYDRLLQSNSEIREELYKICGQTEVLQKLSLPMQVINIALKISPELKDQIWESANKNKEELTLKASLTTLRKEFFNFDFDLILKELRSEGEVVA